MKRIFFMIMICVGIAMNADAKKDELVFDYELSPSLDNIEVASGYVVFKVWTFGKSRSAITKEMGIRNAIHGILFRGLASYDEGYSGNQPAIVPDGYESHKDYFDDFFSDPSKYALYVQETSRGSQRAGDVVKVGKRYKVGFLVQVNVKALRKRMEKDHIIESVGNIFKR